MSALDAFRRAQSRVQRANADRRWIHGVEALNERSERICATVRRSMLGDREVRLSAPSSAALGALRHCREGSSVSTFDRRRDVWSVPAGVWRCVKRELLAAGVEIAEAEAPRIVRARGSR